MIGQIGKPVVVRFTGQPNAQWRTEVGGLCKFLLPGYRHVQNPQDRDGLSSFGKPKPYRSHLIGVAPDINTGLENGEVLLGGSWLPTPPSACPT